MLKEKSFVPEKSINSCGLFLRMTADTVNEKKIEPIDIANAYLDFLDHEKPVWFSHSQFRTNEIVRFVIFTWRRGSWFAAELFFDEYLQSREPFIPAGVSPANTPAQWATTPERCWVHLTGYRDLTLDDLSGFISTRTNTTLNEKIRERGFRAAEFYV